MSDEIHVDDIGVQLRVTVQDDSTAVDLSAATTKQILIRKPSGTLLDKAATYLTDGTDGIIYYDTASGDLDSAGIYKIQAKVVTPDGTFYSSVESFRVHCNA